MQRQLGEEIVFASTLSYFPKLIIPYPIFNQLSQLDLPSPQSMHSILCKLLILKGGASIEQLLKSISLIGNQGTYANKMLLIYAISIFIIALGTFERKNQKRPLAQQTNYVMKIKMNKIDKQCSSVELYIASKIKKTKQQAISFAWDKIDNQTSKYGLLILRRQKRLYVIDKQQTNEIGISLPSIVPIQFGKDLQLIYINDEFANGIQLRQFILLLNFIKHTKQQYDFDNFITHLAKQLQKIIKAQNNQNRFYFILKFKNIFISVNQKTIQINIQPIKIEKDIYKLPQSFNQSIYAYPLAQQNYKKSDKWSIAIILLQTIAFRFGIIRFKRELQCSKSYQQKRKCLGQFISLIQQQRLLVNNHLFYKIKQWLLFDKDTQLSIIDQNQEHGGSVFQYQKHYSKDHSQFQHQYQDSQNIFLSSCELYLQNIQNILKQNSSRIGAIFPENCTQRIRKQVMNPEFVQTKNDGLSCCLIHYDTKCKSCNKQQIVYTNYCGHSKCYDCLKKYVNKKILNRQQKLISCQYCNKPFSIDLIAIILQGSPVQRQFYNQFIVEYAKKHSNRYIYCLNNNCLQNPQIYLKDNQKILLCKQCHNSYCLDCNKSFHYPLDCQSFKKQQNNLQQYLLANKKKIGWPKFMSIKATVQRYQQILAVQQTGLLVIFQKIVKEWLTLEYCFSRSKDKNNTKIMKILQGLSEKVAIILTTIQSFSQGETLVKQLQKILGVRQQILISIFII